MTSLDFLIKQDLVEERTVEGKKSCLCDDSKKYNRNQSLERTETSVAQNRRN